MACLTVSVLEPLSYCATNPRHPSISFIHLHFKSKAHHIVNRKNREWNVRQIKNKKRKHWVKVVAFTLLSVLLPERCSDGDTEIRCYYNWAVTLHPNRHHLVFLSLERKNNCILHLGGLSWAMRGPGPQWSSPTSVLCSLFRGLCSRSPSLTVGFLSHLQTHIFSSQLCPVLICKRQDSSCAWCLFSGSRLESTASYLWDPGHSRQRRHSAPVSSTLIWRLASSVGICRLK